ncbi:MAG: DNA topoisomerase I subunit omega [Gammaproteobacteria bacterium]|nr:MAG: DNA topoisomerase I subunit omega [Gammaproteobacteria bacterium]
MTKSLVIVESPAKAKTINKYLGNDYVVKSSIGHVRDLPTAGSKEPVDAKARAKAAAITRKLSPAQKIKHKAKKAKIALIARMGIDPDNDWAAQYKVLPGKEKVVNELIKLAAKADTIYLATDLDREGEAIAWHLQELIGGGPERFKRVVFNEITKKSIQEAFHKPSEVDLNYVNAQQTRRFLDRIVGFMVSPLLWKKVARGLSAGRVQSVAVKLVTEKERSIRAFNPEEYWELHGDVKSSKSASSLRMQVNKHLGKKYRPDNKVDAMESVDYLNQQSYVVSERLDKPTSSKPSAPFITSSLQQAASTRLGFGVKKTMAMAQRLYEAGHITYMRTDSTSLSKDAVDSCRDYINDQFGKKYLPDDALIYSNKGGAQEAHEAIRPSDVTRTSASLSDQERDAQRLYELIWRQFVACQMTRAQYDASTLNVKAGDYNLTARGRVLRFDGWTRVQTQVRKKDDDIVIPDLTVGEVLVLEKLDPKQHFTKPPARYSEATLVKELEKKGIGRPSTYANIISTIQDRGYVRLEAKRFHARKMGEIVTDRLNENFTDLMNYSFTATMEERLDEIAAGKADWKATLNEFYEDFSVNLAKADSDDGMRQNDPVEIDIKCPDCSRNMSIRTASTGVFLGCTGYALPAKEQCKKTLNLTAGEEAVSVEDDEDAETSSLMAKERCPICSTAMESYLIDESRKLHVCGNNPDCEGVKVEQGQFKIKGYEGPLLDCDKCGSEMQLKNGRFGKYFGCTNEECKNTRKLLRNGQAAPPKADPIPMPMLACEKVEDTYVLRDGAAGIFLAASKFPRNRETRAPKVEELLIVKDQLDPKFNYLTEAPVRDPKKRPAIIRFSRKTKSQYVMSENKEGKATGWVAHYNDGKWVADKSKMKK